MIGIFRKRIQTLRSCLQLVPCPRKDHLLPKIFAGNLKSTQHLYQPSWNELTTRFCLFCLIRICHCEAEYEAPLVAPCCCAGSLKYVHQGCLQRWVQSSDMKNCELCKYPFIMQTKIKPFKEVNNQNNVIILSSSLFCL